MKTYASIVLAVVAILITARESKGQDPLPTLCGEAIVYHSNGVLTSRTNAFRNLSELQGRPAAVMSEEEFEKLSFKLAYNTTNGSLLDLLEATRQDIGTDLHEIFWRYVTGLDPSRPASLREYVETIAAQLDAEALTAVQDLSSHVASYRNALREGNKVVLVAHSQGNFFANQGHANLTPVEHQRFGITSVATPDSYVAGNGSDTTLLEDLVVLAVAVAKRASSSPEPLPSNVTNNLASYDPLGHNFKKAYFARGSNSEVRVLSNIETTLARLGDASTSPLEVWAISPSGVVAPLAPGGIVQGSFVIKGKCFVEGATTVAVSLSEDQVELGVPVQLGTPEVSEDGTEIIVNYSLGCYTSRDNWIGKTFDIKVSAPTGEANIPVAVLDQVVTLVRVVGGTVEILATVDYSDCNGSGSQQIDFTASQSGMLTHDTNWFGLARTVDGWIPAEGSREYDNGVVSGVIVASLSSGGILTGSLPDENNSAPGQTSVRTIVETIDLNTGQYSGTLSARTDTGGACPSSTVTQQQRSAILTISGN